jgi:hypothetical protein
MAMVVCLAAREESAMAMEVHLAARDESASTDLSSLM